jgi:hypothetical protein
MSLMTPKQNLPTGGLDSDYDLSDSFTSFLF